MCKFRDLDGRTKSLDTTGVEVEAAVRDARRDCRRSVKVASRGHKVVKMRELRHLFVRDLVAGVGLGLTMYISKYPGCDVWM